MQQTGYDPLPYEEVLQPCDVQTNYDVNTNVILELKCYTSYVPLWMIDCIRKFQLHRRGFSKYMTALRQADSHQVVFNPVIRSQLYDAVYDEEMV